MATTKIPGTALVLVLAAAAAGQTLHEAPEHGFRVRHPSGWKAVPVKVSERWILARFLCDREYVHRRRDGTTVRHRPTFRVLGFAGKARPVAVKETEREGARTRSVRAPYVDYADYLKRNHRGGGYYFAVEESARIDGVPVSYKEVKVEKLAAAPSRHLVCIYHEDDRDLAVEVDVLESEYGRLKPLLLPCLHSLRLVERKPATQGDAAPPPGGGLWVFEGPEEFRAELAKRRRVWRERVIAHTKETAGGGWRVVDKRDFLVVSNAEAKYTAYVLRQAQLVRRWLDRHFRNVGTGEVLRTVLRVCASSGEAQAYLRGSGDSYVWESGEVVCAQRGGSILGDFSRIAGALTSQYLAEKHPALWGALPDWAARGLMSHASGGRLSKKRGFVFPVPVSELRVLKPLLQTGGLFPLKDLICRPRDDLVADREGGERIWSAQATLLVRYLLDGPGRRGRTKGVLQDVMGQAVIDLEELDRTALRKAFASREATKEPTTEEEEEEAFRRRREDARRFRELFADERARILEGIYGRVFEGWTHRTWKRLDARFRSWLRGNAR